MHETLAEASAAVTECIAALEKRLAIQDKTIAELENHGCNVSIHPTDTAAASKQSGISSRNSGSTVDIQIAEIKAAMQKMAETVSSQATSVAAITQHIANNGGGGRYGGVGGVVCHTTIKKDKHKCEKCKRMVWHKEVDCPEFEQNKHKRWVGWESALK